MGDAGEGLGVAGEKDAAGVEDVVEAGEFWKNRTNFPSSLDISHLPLMANFMLILRRR